MLENKDLLRIAAYFGHYSTINFLVEMYSLTEKQAEEALEIAQKSIKI